MKTCEYCGKDFPDRGLPLHIYRTHQKQVEAKKYYEEEGRRIQAQVHAEVEAKKREFAVKEKQQKLSNELQSLATSVENTWKPLQNCSLCGGTWDNHRPDCPFKKTTSTFDQFLDFMTTLLGGSQQ